MNGTHTNGPIPASQEEFQVFLTVFRKPYLLKIFLKGRKNKQTTTTTMIFIEYLLFARHFLHFRSIGSGWFYKKARCEICTWSIETNPLGFSFIFSLVFACLVLRMCFPVVKRSILWTLENQCFMALFCIWSKIRYWFVAIKCLMQLTVKMPFWWWTFLILIVQSL